jgi:transposase
MGQRRTFRREFKLQAVKLVRNRGVSVAQAARDLVIHENLLRKWTRQQAADPESAFPGYGQMKPEQQEIERLRREVVKLRAERDIIKKAAAYFAKVSTCSSASWRSTEGSARCGGYAGRAVSRMAGSRPGRAVRRATGASTTPCSNARSD